MGSADLRLREALLAVGIAAALVGCVDSYGGSDLQIDFSRGVLVPTGTDTTGAKVPADTYFTFYGTDEVKDADGNVTENVAFDVEEFEIRKVVDTASPCMVELADAQFPGIHVTQFARYLRHSICHRLGLDDHCFDDPFAAPDGATDGDVSDVLDADVRMAHLSAYEGSLRAITTFSTFQYPTPAATCAFTGDQLPPATCIDSDSNAQRLRVCSDLWKANPDYYEGSDKVFTLPLNGKIRGLVEGSNPINGGPVGGSNVLVDAVMTGFDSFSINWQFKDLDGDGDPDYPAAFLVDHDPSDLGYPFLQGRPESRTRGVISSHMVSPFDPNVSAEIAIFANVGEDDVSF